MNDKSLTAFIPGLFAVTVPPILLAVIIRILRPRNRKQVGGFVELLANKDSLYKKKKIFTSVKGSFPP